jgi:hypothetical protein
MGRKKKGQSLGSAHPYAHWLRRSGRSSALPYPPSQQKGVYHEVEVEAVCLHSQEK